MGFEFEVPEKLAGPSANYVNKPFKGLFLCNEVDEAPKGCVGGFQLTCTVMAAESGSEDQVDRTANIKVWPPDPSKPDKLAFTLRVWTHIAVAVGWMKPEQCTPGAKIRIDDAQTAKGRLFYAEIQISDKGFPQLKFDNIFHIDDPAAAEYPRNAIVLEAVPKEHRYSPGPFSILHPSKDQAEKKHDGGSSQLSMVDDL